MPSRQNRITRGDDYRRVVRSGHRVGDANSVVHAVFRAPGDGPTRFGFIVSKAVGNAVQRNLVRRRLKTIAERQIRAGLESTDVVIRALPGSLHAPFATLEGEIDRSLTRLQRRRRDRA